MSKKQTGLSYRKLNDEILALRAKENDMEAYDRLIQKYYAIRVSLLEKVCPNIADFLKDWDLNAVFFQAFTVALQKFDFETGHRFSTYFTACFRNCALHAYRELQTMMVYQSPVSLDSPKGPDDDSGTPSDTLFDTSFNSDVVKMVSSSSLFDDIEKLPFDKYDPFTYTVAVALSRGMTINEIARTLCIDRNRMRRIIEGLRRYLEKREGIHREPKDKNRK